MPAERHFTTRQVAEICGVNLNTVQNWARRSLIEGFRTAGGHLRFRESDLIAFLERQGIPLPEELARDKPRVFCACRDCEPAKAMARWLRREFECTHFEDPWELAVAVGAESPDLLIVDVAGDDVETRRMLDVVATNPKTADVPVIVLTSAPGENGAGESRTELPRDGLKPAVLRKSAEELLQAAAERKPSAGRSGRGRASDRGARRRSRGA